MHKLWNVNSRNPLEILIVDAWSSLPKSLRKKSIFNILLINTSIYKCSRFCCLHIGHYNPGRPWGQLRSLVLVPECHRCAKKHVRGYPEAIQDSAKICAGLAVLELALEGYACASVGGRVCRRVEQRWGGDVFGWERMDQAWRAVELDVAAQATSMPLGSIQPELCLLSNLHQQNHRCRPKLPHRGGWHVTQGRETKIPLLCVVLHPTPTMLDTVQATCPAWSRPAQIRIAP